MLPEGYCATANTESVLGECLAKLRRYDEAEPLSLESYAIIKAASAAPPRRKLEALQRLIELYDAWGKPERADEYRALLPQPEPATQPVTQPASRAAENRARAVGKEWWRLGCGLGRERGPIRQKDPLDRYARLMHIDAYEVNTQH